MVTHAWSDGLYLDGAAPSADLPYGDVYSFKMLPLPDDRCLVVYEWEQGNTNVPNAGGVYSLRARIVTAGDPPTGGNVVTVDNLKATLVDLFGPPGAGWRVGLNYAFGLTRISDTRAILTTTGQRSFFDDGSRQYHRLSYLSVTLLAIDGLTVTVLDRWFDAQDSDDTGHYYSEYPTSVSLSGGRALIFAHSQDVNTDSFQQDTVCRIVTVASDRLAVGPALPTPLGNCFAGAWSDPTGSFGCVIGASPSAGPNNPGELLAPFTVSGDNVSFTAIPNFPWRNRDARISESARWRFLVEGIPGQGPQPNQFLMSVGDEPSTANDYLNVALVQTDGVTATLANESMGYNDDSGFGYPDAWLPSVTYDGKVVSLYSNGRTYWDTHAGGHGHQHGGDPVLLIDVMGKTSYDDVTEVQMPRTGNWAAYEQDIGFWIRDIAATESGIFIILSTYLANDLGNQAAMVGWVPLSLSAPLTAEFTFDASGRVVTFDSSPSQAGNYPITSYAWDFGDAAYGVLPGQPAEGETLTHTYLALTLYTVTLTVTDLDGNTASVSHQVALEQGAIDGDFVNDRYAFSGSIA